MYHVILKSKVDLGSDDLSFARDLGGQKKNALAPSVV